jgi:hypothetical protein
VTRPSLPPGTSSAHKQKLTPLAIARADVVAGRYTTLRAERPHEGSYWYVGHHVDVPLHKDRPEGPQALKFETVAGPFVTRGAADKVIERARARADRES